MLYPGSAPTTGSLLQPGLTTQRALPCRCLTEVVSVISSRGGLAPRTSSHVRCITPGIRLGEFIHVPPSRQPVRPPVRGAIPGFYPSHAQVPRPLIHVESRSTTWFRSGASSPRIPTPSTNPRVFWTLYASFSIQEPPLHDKHLITNPTTPELPYPSWPSNTIMFLLKDHSSPPDVGQLAGYESEHPLIHKLRRV